MQSNQTSITLVLRIAASLFGGYFFVWGFTTLGITLGVAAGMAYSEARTLLFLLAFLLFLVCFCWAYVESSVNRVWSVFAGGGVLMTTGAWLLAAALV